MAILVHCSIHDLDEIRLTLDNVDGRANVIYQIFQAK